jgi:hypothetical protein
MENQAFKCRPQPQLPAINNVTTGNTTYSKRSGGKYAHRAHRAEDCWADHAEKKPGWATSETDSTPRPMPLHLHLLPTSNEGHMIEMPAQPDTRLADPESLPSSVILVFLMVTLKLGPNLNGVAFVSPGLEQDFAIILVPKRELMLYQMRRSLAKGGLSSSIFCRIFSCQLQTPSSHRRGRPNTLVASGGRVPE